VLGHYYKKAAWRIVRAVPAVFFICAFACGTTRDARKNAERKFETTSSGWECVVEVAFFVTMCVGVEIGAENTAQQIYKNCSNFNFWFVIAHDNSNMAQKFYTVLYKWYYHIKRIYLKG
jgi:hypothetical protein